MNAWLERRFGLAAAGTTVRTEVLAGATTFLTLCYIVLFQPAILSVAGVPADVGLFATCVASAVACGLMAFLANYPIALAPAMGHNVFFVFVACGSPDAGGFGLSWQQGLAAVFLSGSLFLALATVRFRERVVEAIPTSLKHAIAAGIGLLIALLGLQWGGLVADHPVTLVQLGDLHAPVARLSLLGLVVALVLLAARVRAALLGAIVVTAAAGMAAGLLPVPERWVTSDPGGRLVLGELDFAGLLGSSHVVEVLFVLFLLDLFDTVGTLVGVGARAGLLVDGRLPRAGRALLADAGGTVVGASLGTSTVTSYVESAAGVAAGGRTGLTALVTGVLFLLALPLSPVVAVIGEPVVVDGTSYYPVLAPVLIAVGALMAASAASIRWDQPRDALPCFLAMAMMPVTFSIGDGIAFGCIGLALSSLVTGHARERSPLLYVIAAAFVVKFVVVG